MPVTTVKGALYANTVNTMSNVPNRPERVTGRVWLTCQGPKAQGLSSLIAMKNLAPAFGYGVASLRLEREFDFAGNALPGFSGPLLICGLGGCLTPVRHANPIRLLRARRSTRAGEKFKRAAFHIAIVEPESELANVRPPRAGRLILGSAKFS